jgi:hypothetical protein
MINRMNVFDQAHVARKVAPIWFGMGRGYIQAQQHRITNDSGEGYTNGEDQAGGAVENAIMFEAMQPISEILAKMEDEDVNYVLKKCLAVCQRWNGQQWVPMMRGGNLMFEDIDLATLLQLVMEVVSDNLGPSLLGLLGQRSATEDSPSPSI